jgi:hypothetical protein
MEGNGVQGSKRWRALSNWEQKLVSVHSMFNSKW